ncbi:MAG: DUF1549 domain-containing protein, partial [Planctomycetia bacterium]|nr:DUF1549 domain-containing protein [Planctomycetia bacterium]
MSRLLLVLLLVSPVAAAEPAKDKAALAKQLSAAIDRHLAADWSARGIKPAALADDAEFVRRVYLDIIGRIPRVAETTEFLADPAADKRAKLVDRLLSMPNYARHFGATTRQEWMPQAATDVRFFFNGQQFEEWLQTEFRKNAPLDAMVREVLTVKMPEGLARFREIDEFRNDPNTNRVAAF